MLSDTPYFHELQRMDPAERARIVASLKPRISTAMARLASTLDTLTAAEFNAFRARLRSRRIAADDVAIVVGLADAGLAIIEANYLGASNEGEGA